MLPAYCIALEIVVNSPHNKCRKRGAGLSSPHSIPTRSAPLLCRLTQLYLAVMLSLFLILPGLRGYQDTTRSAFLYFTGLSVLYLAAMALAAAELALTGGGTLRSLLAPLSTRSTVRRCFLLYLGWSALSAVCSPVGGAWIGLSRYEGLLTILLYILVFLAVSAYGRWDRRFLYLLGGVTAGNALLGLLQYAGQNPFSLFPPGTDFHDAFILYNGQFMGTLGNVDILSAFLCLTVPLFYGAYCLRGRWPALLPLGAGAFLLALADVDGGYLGIGTALLLTMPVYCRRGLPWGRALSAMGVAAAALGAGWMLHGDSTQALCLRPGVLSWAALLGGALLAAAGAALSRRQAAAPSPSPAKTARRMWLALAALAAAGLIAVYCFPFSAGPAQALHQILHGNLDPAFGSGRIRIWQEVLRLIGEAPLLGGGPDTLLPRMTFTFSRYIPAAGQVVEAVADAAHNDFLNIAVNQGLPALGFYLAGLLAWFTALSKRGGDTALTVLPAVTAYLAQSFFNVKLCTVSALFWILLAMGESDINPSIHKEEQKT